MKKFKKYLTIAFLFVVFLVTGCGESITPPPATTDKITVTALEESIYIKDTEVAEFNLKELFEIKVNDKKIDVADEYINKGALSSVPGTYDVSCLYEGIVANLKVIVTRSEYTLEQSKTEITIKETEVETYNFKSLFKATIDKEEIIITDDMVSSNVESKPGKYTFKVTNGTISKTLYINVIHVTKIEILASTDQLEVEISKVSKFDFTSLFTLHVDDVQISVTNDMLNLAIIANPVVGNTYEVTLSYRTQTNEAAKTINVKVIDDIIVKNNIEIVPAYNSFTLYVSEVHDFDFTKLFTIYVNNKAIQVTKDMLDLSNLENIVVNQTYQITIIYQIEEDIASSSIEIKVLEDEKVFVNVKNIVIYPNASALDLTSLFEIKKGEKNIPVTIDMITGTIDYSNVGMNEITLTYDNQTYIATVEVKRGVIIDYTHSEVIQILKGTNQESYDFAGDFKVIINGIEFENIPDSYLDMANVDFNEVGTYTVTIKIPYNDNKIGLSGVKFTYFEKTISYKVINSNFEINVLEENVLLPSGTTKYNVFNNLKVTINGRNQQLTDNPLYEDMITCYAKQISEPLDFNSSRKQEVQIDVYANGANEDPIRVTFYVMINSNITIHSSDMIIFTGDSFYALDLFTILSNGEEIEVELGMISGMVDTFTKGVYTLEINYNDITATAKVFVLDNAMKGTYHTGQTTIPAADDDDDYESEWGSDGEDWGTYATIRAATLIGDLVIDNANTMMVDGKIAKVVSGIDENTIIVSIGTNKYTLYYMDGIIVLDPDNSIKLGFSDYRRPLIYFNESKWQIGDKVTINYGSKHVLQGTTTNYSIDCFQIESTTKTIWYGLKVELIQKTSADTVYDVTFGEVKFASDFQKNVGIVSSLTYNGKTYVFTMQSREVGKVNNSDTEEKYKNVNFTGMINNQPAELKFNQYGALAIYINGKLIEDVGTYNIMQMKNGGYHVNENYIFVYDFGESTYSYKFTIDSANNTFVLEERDSFFGVYENNNIKVFIDGYGTGIINFNTKSYYQYQFKYEANGNIIVAEFVNTNSTFQYGKTIEFYMADLLNVLTIKDAKVESHIGLNLINKYITDGAIINISTYKIGQEADNIAKANLYSAIEIITKDGNLTTEEKAKVIDTSKIRFNTPGFYELSINVSVNGETITTYYAIEIIESIYPNNPVVAIYGNGVLLNKNSLSIDEYGRAVIVCSGVVYNGVARIQEDGTFSITAKNDKKIQLTMTGEMLTEGLIKVTCGGAVSFVDYFTTGTHNVSGTDKFVLREFIVKGEKLYVLATSEASLGEFVSVESLNGVNPSTVNAILKVVSSNSESYCLINSWNDGKNGLTLADKYRGIYTLDGNDSIEIDGFGNAKVGSTSGTYMINSGVATITTNSTTKVYRLNTNNNTYEIINITLDNSLLSGKTYTSDYTYLCGYYPYVATTTFTFKENGKVLVQSVSPMHDDGEDACEDDRYDPPFATSKGMEGTYQVNGNKVTINVNGYKFIFLINNVLTTSDMTCLEATTTSSEHGSIKVGTIFDKQ